MKRSIPVVLIVIFLYGCNFYDKKYHRVAVGEKLEIYFSTNSCCYYCLQNEEQLQHVRLTGKKMVKPDPEGCAGCDYKGAFVFEGIAPGIDTVKLNEIGATMTCDSANGDPEVYIINVH